MHTGIGNFLRNIQFVQNIYIDGDVKATVTALLLGGNQSIISHKGDPPETLAAQFCSVPCLRSKGEKFTQFTKQCNRRGQSKCFFAP